MGDNPLRILLVSDHRYPGSGSHSAGLQPRTLPSGSGYHIHDLLARGLAELGHEVFYLLQQGVAEPLPANIIFVSDPVPSVDIVHAIYAQVLTADIIQGVPWVASCHRHIKNAMALQYPTIMNNWIFVSQTQAAAYGSKRFVYNGIDPADHIYSEVKSKYFLFLSDISRYKEKGLNFALKLSKKCQFDLVVAGTSNDVNVIEEVSNLCSQYDAQYIGDIRGLKKAEVFSHAKALIFPTQWGECCPLVIAESLMSGTPVIVSNDAACVEMICDDVGFICSHENDYIHAINNIDSVSPYKCRDYAMKKYHYMKMTNNYVKEYNKQILSYNSK